MTPIFRLLLTALIGFFVIAGAELFKANAATDLPRDPKRGGELDDGAEYDLVQGAMPEYAAKVALGNNANAVLSLDLIANGGAGNQVIDGVTTGAVAGRGAKIALEIFATGVTTTLRGVILRFDFDASLVSFVKAENSAFSLSLPEGSVGAALAATSPATLATSGFLARAEFETVADVTGRAFSIGIESVTLAESSASSDVLTTSSEISFNAAPSPDFDGDGTVGFSDFLTFAGAFGSRQGDAKYNAAQDLNSDGSIDFTDFLIFAGDFGSQVPPSGGGGTTTPPSGNPDLIVESPSVDDNTLTTGQSFTLSSTVRNQGNASAAATTLRYYSSTNATISTDDTEVGTDAVSALSAGATSAESIRLNAPSDTGTYYYGACVDDVTGESNTGNNCSSGVNVTVSGGGGGETVTIADDSLRAVIADSLGKAPDAPITRVEMLTLTHIEAPNRGIRSLSGLEYANNLTTLKFGRVWSAGRSSNSNDISDLSPLSNLTKLKTLDLSGNSISDISVLTSLTNLGSLVLGENSISDISALPNLTNLGALFLQENNISDISVLSNMPNLYALYLDINSISDISALSNLTKLDDLSLSQNDISDVSALSNLTDLKWLVLSRNSITDVSALSILIKLTWLDLGANSIWDISALSSLTDLETLFLWSNAISEISALSNLTDLKWLVLRRNSITDISPLVANSGLGDGDKIDLGFNPLNRASRDTHIPALQRRGVTVEFDGGTTPPPADGPDLIVEFPSVDDNMLTDGQSFTLSATVRNQGNEPAAATTLRYYRSTNATISTDDTEEGTDAVGALSAGATSAESISLNAPSSAGTYYYGACVDDVSGESNTDNNCSSGVSVTVSGGGGGSGGACRAGLVVNPGETCTYKGNTFSVSSSGRGSIAFFSAGTAIDARGSTINGVRWNFHATKNSGSNSWTIHVAD